MVIFVQDVYSYNCDFKQDKEKVILEIQLQTTVTMNENVEEVEKKQIYDIIVLEVFNNQVWKNIM